MLQSLRFDFAIAIDVVNAVRESFELGLDDSCLNAIWTEVIATANSCNIFTMQRLGDDYSV